MMQLLMMMTIIMIRCLDNGVCNYNANAMMDDEWRWLNVCCRYHQWRLDIPWWITNRDVNDCGDDKNNDGGGDDDDDDGYCDDDDYDDNDDDDDDGGGSGGGGSYIEWSCRVVMMVMTIIYVLFDANDSCRLFMHALLFPQNAFDLIHILFKPYFFVHQVPLYSPFPEYWFFLYEYKFECCFQDTPGNLMTQIQLKVFTQSKISS